MQLALTRHPELPSVPLVLDLAKTDEQKAILRLIFARQVIAYPFVAPPGIPPERAEILRAAFMETMRDKEFLAEAEKAQLEIRPVAGADADAERLIVETYATPAPVVQKVVEMLK